MFNLINLGPAKGSEIHRITVRVILWFSVLLYQLEALI